MGETALVAPPPANSPKYRRITQAQRQVMRDLYKLNTPQTEIARVLGVSQGTVSKWLSELVDTTADATEYLRSQALYMAEKVVKKGRPSDHIKALQGVNVLTEERSSGLVIQIGGGSGDVKVAVMTGTFAPQDREPERKVSESLAITLGSDNQSYVNQD